MKWLKRFIAWVCASDPPCECKRPQWRVLIEHYPSYTKDLWKCERCKRTAVFAFEEGPIKPKTKICDMGHVHIAN